MDRTGSFADWRVVGKRKEDGGVGDSGHSWVESIPEIENTGGRGGFGAGG